MTMSNVENTKQVTVAVRHLMVGDVTTSGIEITHRPYTSTRIAKGKLHVVGRRIGSGNPFRGEWNASTTMTVTRADSVG